MARKCEDPSCVCRTYINAANDEFLNIVNENMKIGLWYKMPPHILAFVGNTTNEETEEEEKKNEKQSEVEKKGADHTSSTSS